MTTMSAREFNHDVSAAKRAATREPVIITDRGVPPRTSFSQSRSFVDLPGRNMGLSNGYRWMTTLTSRQSPWI